MLLVALAGTQCFKFWEGLRASKIINLRHILYVSVPSPELVMQWLLFLSICYICVCFLNLFCSFIRMLHHSYTFVILGIEDQAV